MASTISLVLSTKTAGNSKSESMSVTNINAQATNAQIVEFVNMLMALSTNRLVSISKVTKEEVYNNG